MKKLLTVSAVLATAAMSAMAQGQLNANGNILQVMDPAINGGTPVLAGKAATVAGFGPGEGPGQITVTIYAAANGTSLQALEASSPLATVQSSSSTLTSGVFAFGNPFSLPNSVGVFDGTAPIEVILKGVSADGKYAGFSSEGTGIIPGSGSGNPATIFGAGAGLINSFVMTPVPEPSTIALGGLGAAALMYFRRRK